MTSSFKKTLTALTLLFIAILSGSTVLAQGTVLADTGFRPQQNGFSFENYGNETNPVNLTPASMQSVFGARVCKAVQDGNCVLTATAQEWMDKINKDMDGGHCEGMAAVSKLIYTGEVKLQDLDPNAQSIADLKPDNPLVQAEIAKWFATQYVPPTASNEIRDQTPGQVVDTLVEQLKEGNGPFTMGIYQADGNGGHAITPYSVVDMGDGVTRVMVYDNNYPGQERFIEVDRNSNTWKYTGTTNPDEPVSEYSGSADSFSLTLTPATARTTRPQECTFCKPDDGGMATEPTSGETTEVVATDAPEGTGSDTTAEATEAAPEGDTTEPESTDPCNQTAVSTGPNTDMVITTADGHKAGVVNGRAFSDIEGATIFQPRSQTGLDEDTPGAVIMLPSDAGGGNMSVSVSGEGGDDVLMMTCGQYQRVEGLSQEDGAPDTIVFDPEATSVSAEVDAGESLNLEGGYNNPEGDDQTYSLSDVTSENGSIVSVGADPETGEFGYASSGGTTFDINISALDQNGDTYTSEYEVESGENEGLSINLSDAVYDPDSNFEFAEVDPADFDDYIESRDAAAEIFEEEQALSSGEFVDEDGDGIDDETGEEIPSDEFVDEDGDGIDDETGEEIPSGEFIDEDGDGIDDETGEEIPSDEPVDEDGDGIDDATGEDINNAGDDSGGESEEGDDSGQDDGGSGQDDGTGEGEGE